MLKTGEKFLKSKEIEKFQFLCSKIGSINNVKILVIPKEIHRVNTILINILAKIPFLIKKLIQKLYGSQRKSNTQNFGKKNKFGRFILHDSKCITKI